MATARRLAGAVPGGAAGTPSRADRMLAVTMSVVILVTLVMWIALKEEAAKYVLYTLPATITISYLAVNAGRVKLNRPGLKSLLIYIACAVASMAVNSAFEFLNVRDFGIISGYLLLFALWFRCPPTIVDASMFTLAVGMLVEAATEGIGESINLFGSEGILESTLAFPIGLILIFYLHHRQWTRALIAAIWLFLAFKRITFLGVMLAVGFDVVIASMVRLGKARAIAFVIVVTLSLISLFSLQIFELVADLLHIQNTSANSISLGRYEMAQKLWEHVWSRPVTGWIFGSGPASADTLLTLKMGSATANNPHNDWLKILFDYGIVGFVAIHGILLRNLTENRLGILLYLYSAVVMMTDNVFIYMFYQPFVLIMICVARGAAPASPDRGVASRRG